MGVNHDLAYDLLLARRDRAGLTLPSAQAEYYRNALTAAGESSFNVSAISTEPA